MQTVSFDNTLVAAASSAMVRDLPLCYTDEAVGAAMNNLVRGERLSGLEWNILVLPLALALACNGCGDASFDPGTGGAGGAAGAAGTAGDGGAGGAVTGGAGGAAGAAGTAGDGGAGGAVTGGAGGAAGAAGAAGDGGAGGTAPPEVDWSLLPIGGDITMRFYGDGFDVTRHHSEWTFMRTNYHPNQSLVSFQIGGIVIQIYLFPDLGVGTTIIETGYNNTGARIVVAPQDSTVPLAAQTSFFPPDLVSGSITINTIDLAFGGFVTGSFSATINGENEQSTVDIFGTFFTDIPTEQYVNGVVAP